MAPPTENKVLHLGHSSDSSHTDSDVKRDPDVGLATDGAVRSKKGPPAGLLLEELTADSVRSKPQPRSSQHSGALLRTASVEIRSKGSQVHILSESKYANELEVERAVTLHRDNMKFPFGFNLETTTENEHFISFVDRKSVAFGKLYDMDRIVAVNEIDVFDSEISQLQKALADSSPLHITFNVISLIETVDAHNNKDINNVQLHSPTRTNPMATFNEDFAVQVKSLSQELAEEARAEEEEMLLSNVMENATSDAHGHSNDGSDSDSTVMSDDDASGGAALEEDMDFPSLQHRSAEILSDCLPHTNHIMRRESADQSWGFRLSNSEFGEHIIFAVGDQGAAAVAGLKDGDAIVALNDVSTVGHTFEEVVSILGANLVAMKVGIMDSSTDKWRASNHDGAEHSRNHMGAVTFAEEIDHPDDSNGHVFKREVLLKRADVGLDFGFSIEATSLKTPGYRWRIDHDHSSLNDCRLYPGDFLFKIGKVEVGNMDEEALFALFERQTGPEGVLELELEVASPTRLSTVYCVESVPEGDEPEADGASNSELEYISVPKTQSGELGVSFLMTLDRRHCVAEVQPTSICIGLLQPGDEVAELSGVITRGVPKLWFINRLKSASKSAKDGGCSAWPFSCCFPPKKDTPSFTLGIRRSKTMMTMI